MMIKFSFQGNMEADISEVWDTRNDIMMQVDPSNKDQIIAGLKSGQFFLPLPHAFDNSLDGAEYDISDLEEISDIE